MNKVLPALLLLLAGCAQQPVTVDVPGLERSAAVQVRDLRPETEKQYEVFSLSVSSDAYALYRLADNAVAPSATRILQHRAFEKLAAGAPEIKLHHLVVYRNLQAEFRRAAILGGIGGALGAAVAGPMTTDHAGVTSALANGKLFESLVAGDEYKRALYSAQENPANSSVVIVYIESEIGGKRVFTRSIGPSVKEGQNMLVSDVESAIRFHLAQYP